MGKIIVLALLIAGLGCEPNEPAPAVDAEAADACTPAQGGFHTGFCFAPDAGSDAP